MSVKERCKTKLIEFADRDIVSSMVVCIKEGINAETYLERLAELAEREPEDNDFSEAIKAATEGYRLADKIKKDDSSMLPRGTEI